MIIPRLGIRSKLCGLMQLLTSVRARSPTMHFVEMISAGYPGSAYHPLMGRVNATLVELVTAAHRERQSGWLGSCGRAGQPEVSIWSAGTGLRPGARSV